MVADIFWGVVGFGRWWDFIVSGDGWWWVLFVWCWMVVSIFWVVVSGSWYFLGGDRWFWVFFG